MSLPATSVRLVVSLSVLAALGASGSARLVAAPGAPSRLDPVLQERAIVRAGHSRVIIRGAAATPAAVRALVEKHHGAAGRALAIIGAHVATVPNAALAALASSPLVAHVSLDRAIVGALERTGGAVGSVDVRQVLGYDGTGIGVAIVDSGITAWHDDLGTASGASQRVTRFVDFVDGRVTAYDDYGHGTHVAGIVAGNGFDSGGARAGIAPRAQLTVLKVLDASGRGRVSDAIAALDYVVEHRGELDIRVVNLSINAAAHESYDVDPLTLAAKQAVARGIVVVAAAGNAGRRADGVTQYGSVLAPANAPWVLTVGASSHMGTTARHDDAVAPFSSRGPGAAGNAAKPDIVAPGVGIESLSDPASAFYTTRANFLLPGTVATSYLPYLSASGTSMSAPVVSGTVALMLQANPGLTPNLVKAILQYTAQPDPASHPLTQGAGFLNAKGAVELARHLDDPAVNPFPSTLDWGQRFFWGNRVLDGGRFATGANAWSRNVTWGAHTTPGGESVTWGEGWRVGENVVWGPLCAGNDCQSQWSTSAVAGLESTGVVWGVDDNDGVVWGVDGDDGVVWGMTCGDASCGSVIWGAR